MVIPTLPLRDCYKLLLLTSCRVELSTLCGKELKEAWLKRTAKVATATHVIRGRFQVTHFTLGPSAWDVWRANGLKLTMMQSE